MPQMMKIEVNPEYKATTPADKEQLELAKSKGDLEVTYQTGVEAIKLSKGLYRQKEEEAAVLPVARLEDKSIEELKVMLVGLGIKTEKQMKRTDIIGLIQRKLDEIEVLDE